MLVKALRHFYAWYYQQTIDVYYLESFLLSVPPGKFDVFSALYFLTNVIAVIAKQQDERLPGLGKMVTNRWLGAIYVVSEFTTNC
jgi:hypothetical protein